MRFSHPNSKPKLTPLGLKLLQISDHKLTNLEPLLFGRDLGASLLKGVVVRQAVRSAWRSVDESYESDLTDWRSLEAMGVGVISEEEEEEEEEDPAKAEERWFDELLQTLNEDEDPIAEHERAESISSTAASQDIGHDEEVPMEMFSMPPPSTFPAPSTVTYSEHSVPVGWDETRVEIEDATSECTDYDFESICSIDEEDLDDFDDVLVPSLHRSSSSSSTSSAGEEDDECITPKGTCEDLEEAASGMSSFSSTRKVAGGLGLFIDSGGSLI